MASLRKKPSKKGLFIINVPDKCIVNNESQLTIQTFKNKWKQAEDVLNLVNGRITKVRLGQKDISDWKRNDKIEWLRSGQDPIRLEETDGLTLFECHDRYIEECQDKNATSTVDGYIDHLKRAKQYFGDVSLSSIAKDDLQKFITWLDKQTITNGKNRGQKLGLPSKKEDVATLLRVFKWAASIGENLNLSIFYGLKYQKTKTSDLDYLTPYNSFTERQADLKKYGIDESREGAFRQIIYSNSELTENLKYLRTTLWDDGTFETRRLFVTVLVCCRTGARRSELCRIKRHDLDLENKSVMLWLRKGSKDAELKAHRRELTDDTIPFLRALLHQTPADQKCIFCPNDDHMLGASWNQSIEKFQQDKLSRKLKTALAKSKFHNVNGFHVYRHTLASLLLVNGVSQTEVKNTIGWCTDEIVQRYQHITRERRRALLESAIEDVSTITINN